jgi:hypothetical protein
MPRSVSRGADGPLVENGGDGARRVALPMPPDTPSRRFPVPWRVVSIPGRLACWRVEDATGMALAYVYGDDARGSVNGRELTRNGARRVAVGIARIPERQGRGCAASSDINGHRFERGQVAPYVCDDRIRVPGTPTTSAGDCASPACRQIRAMIHQVTAAAINLAL